MFRTKINTSHLSASRADVILFLLPICLCLDSSEVKCNTAGELALVGDPENSSAEFISV